MAVRAVRAVREATGDRGPLSTTPPLMDWKGLLKTFAIFAATNIVFWLVSFSPFRVICLLCLCLLLLLLVQLLGDIEFFKSRGSNLWRTMTKRVWP